MAFQGYGVRPILLQVASNLLASPAGFLPSRLGWQCLLLISCQENETASWPLHCSWMLQDLADPEYGLVAEGAQLDWIWVLQGHAADH